MPSPFQQQSRLRKLVYTVLIVALFTATLVFRRAPSYGVEAQQANLELREHSLGEVELTGSALRLMLTGSRGLAVCSLWLGAIEKQKKHEWNELELLVRSVTKLQPHFITPWLFQSWNLAYNVSVESDRVKDKYFYITRGIELLGEGERQNRNNPDLRFTIGFYNQHKIGLSDEANTFRCLYQMSCVPPGERDASVLRPRGEDGRPQVDPAKFEEFCQKNPMLVRRLRDWLKCETPEDVIDFLAANHKIPHRYEDEPAAGVLTKTAPRLKPPEQQFPLLPPTNDPDATPTQDVRFDFDNYVACRAWFSYAQEPLPPPSAKPTLENPPYDRTRYRMPRAMAVHIFRGYPARGQSYVAEALQKEGWFDREGWLITGWFPDDKFTGGGRTRDAVVGDQTDWAERAWSKAYEMWRDHGIKNGLYFTPEQISNLDNQAGLYRKTMGLEAVSMPVDLPPDRRTPELEESYDAHSQLYWYDRHRDMTNFPHFFYRSEVEMDKDAIQARKLFFQAEQLRKQGNRDQALAKYEAAMPVWRDLLKAHREFRRDPVVQEETYEIELKYQPLARALRSKSLKQVFALVEYIGRASFGPPVPVPSAYEARDMPVPVGSPFDVLADDGLPLIDADAKARVRGRMGLPDPSAAPATPPAGTPGSGPAATPPAGPTSGS